MFLLDVIMLFVPYVLLFSFIGGVTSCAYYSFWSLGSLCEVKGGALSNIDNLFLFVCLFGKEH